MRIATIDPTGPLPKYMQLRSILIQVIEDGGLAAGAPLPSERELCRTYRLSRMTVRQTLELLVAEGRLRRRPGKGTFVASSPERTPEPAPARPLCLADGLRTSGLRLGFADLGERTVDAGARLAHALATEPGTAVHLLTRLVLADGEPVAVERSCVLARWCPAWPPAAAPSRRCRDCWRGRSGWCSTRPSRRSARCPPGPPTRGGCGSGPGARRCCCASAGRARACGAP
nr:GntR family transcriptional regulator [Actinomadura litoris]